ncbi:uncharacterized protein LTR77_006429 [Saxophila tyrrhenica]|uniref:non-specific serine/threonine protein kinase n=1 Tax=Saxophila tyrrhenica TaxID=1690608 RepID=A0AAV9PC41_9PEZI|nr:hypothetical protein LTR77_006429 [Saxophila tyrrhenica]
MPLLNFKWKGPIIKTPGRPLEKRKSNIFSRNTTGIALGDSSRDDSEHKSQPSPLSRLRRRGSQLLTRLHLLPVTPIESTMDGTSKPHYRVLTPPAPALIAPTRSSPARPLHTSSSNDRVEAEVPQRKRSVRFEGYGDDQLDGHKEATSEGSPTPRARDSARSSSSQRLSNQMDSLAAKLNGTAGTQTIVHRSNRKQKPTVPFANTRFEDFAENGEAGASSPSTVSSLTPSAHNQTWSPASTASTAATSWASPRSSGPKFRNRQSPEDCQTGSKSISNTLDEGILPPIQEDSGRFLMIPVQESPIETQPSIATVENVVAAKVFVETQYQKILLEPSSPRSMRRRKFENKMSDLGFSHDERVESRERWQRAESDHLRQMRILHSSSVARHKAKGVSIAGFDVIRVLGKGSFGVVRLVTERKSSHAAEGQDSKQAYPRRGAGGIAVSNVDGTAKRNLPAGKPLSDVFAMKVIRKSDMLRACQEGHLRAERDFLVGAEDSNWVVPLIASFQDNTNLYLVMEYMIGGDFLGLLLREDVLDEEVAK